jgi:hypothetical protein
MQHLKEGMIGELSESCVFSVIEQKLCRINQVLSKIILTNTQTLQLFTISIKKKGFTKDI